jgi:hypothetical protein
MKASRNHHQKSPNGRFTIGFATLSTYNKPKMIGNYD